MSEHRDKLGNIIVGFNGKQQHQAEVGELLPEELQRYINEMARGLAQGKKKFNQNFFIEVMKKRERLLVNVLPRIYAIPRQTCPTPNNDQDVFYYSRADDRLEFIWSVPDPETCRFLKTNALYLTDSDQQLLKYVLDFEDGTLFKVMKKFNREKDDSPELREERKLYV